MRRAAKQLFYGCWLAWTPHAIADWSAPTAGLPVVQHISARDIGTGNGQWTVAEDALGRILVGGDGLFAYDGQAWQHHAIGRSYAVRAIQFDGAKTWIGGSNEIGYLEEPAPNQFRFHSLLDQLPAAERQVGDIWGCALVGTQVHFFGRDRVFGWNGQAFHTWRFPGAARLFPLKLNGETWFHHLESGLYRLTSEGPVLEIGAALLPPTGILGLARDERGLLLICGEGFYRSGSPARPEFGPDLNQYLAHARISAYLTLRDGTHAVGTISGGLVLVSPAGTIQRQLDAENGLPSSAIFSLMQDATGEVWCSSNNGIFHFNGGGEVTLFNRANGLPEPTLDIAADGERLYVCTQSGVFEPKPAGPRGAAMEKILTLSSRAIKIVAGGILLGRQGGLDFYDGKVVTNVYALQANSVTGIFLSRLNAQVHWIADGRGFARLEQAAGGSFQRERFEVDDFPIGGIHEDDDGRLWFGTLGQGVFVRDPVSHAVSPVPDPETGAPFQAGVALDNSTRDLLLFGNGKVLRAAAGAPALRVLFRVPTAGSFRTCTAVGEGRYLLSFKRAGATEASARGQGIGEFTVDASGKPAWRELDLPALSTIGFVQTTRFTHENGKPVLWLGGTEGALRVDYDTLREMAAPDRPLVRLDYVSATAPGTGPLAMPFRDHRLAFRLFPGDCIRSKDWLFQTRLVRAGTSGEWSAPWNRRSHEFSNLSEGRYRFEARAVNAAGQASAIAESEFRILPPWYRSPAAYLVYALCLGLGVWGLVWFRERRIRAQKERLETLVQVRTAELVKANAAKDEFLAGVSHEIRNPMNGVIGISESLNTDGLDANDRRKFGMLRECASHLSSLLEDILDFSRMQAGLLELERRPFDLVELVDGVAAMVAAESEKSKIPVEVAISPAVPRHLEGDPRRVRQILLNFVGNALKFSGRGRVMLTVWCRPAATPDLSEVIFAVSDDGPGIAPAEQARLFVRFERGTAARDRRAPGTGLGLALCKGFAEGMGGSIWLESELGRGSSFYFSAPFHVRPAPDATPAPAATADRSGRALVVDDQEYNRVVLADLLGDLGYAVTTAGDGEAALRHAQADVFDLIFLDYDLPGASGLEVARRIRALEKASAQARILATTAFSTPEKQQECRAAGMDAFLGKPVTMARLRRVLEAGAGDIPAAPAPKADDPLANLRLLARKKQVPFEEELALFLSELQVEAENLRVAIDDEDPRAAARSAHLLCGRFSFIHERTTEARFRRMEELVAREHWSEARGLHAEVVPLLAGLPLRLVSAAPAAPPS